MPHSAPTAVVVDDSATMRLCVKKALIEAGYHVIAEGASGAEGVALYERHRPDLVTLDIVMPVMDGVTAAKRILGAHPDAKVVMCSSLSSRDKILECRNAGVAHFIIKPSPHDRMVQIFKYVGAKNAREAASMGAAK